MMPADPVTLFEAERPRLVGLAYRVTGSRADAEDAVQDAWLRWQRTDTEEIDSPAAWLTTVTARLALDRLRSAAHQRETYVGPWLPDPVATEPGPAEQAELAESLTFGFLTMLERLGPVERVVFLLADVFAVPFEEIGTVVGRSPEACRQVASRARRRVREERPRFTATDDDAWQTAAAFMAAAQLGDIDHLLELLTEDAVLVSDGGAETRAARHPISGPERVARFLANISRKATEGTEVTIALVNNEPGAVLRVKGKAVMTIAIEASDGRVRNVWIVRNRDKLAALDA